MTSKLSQMQARFQQKQMQEREEKLLKLYENQQQRAFDRVGRGSAGSDSSFTTTITGNGKVRQLFEERRQKAGIDRSYPLEPLKNKTNEIPRGKSMERLRNNGNTTTVKSTVRQPVQKPIRNSFAAKREITKLYNNSSTDDEAEDFLKQEEIIALMNNQNLSDNIEDESMPHIGFDDFDETIFTAKLNNIGGKLPSETMAEKKAAEPKTKVISNAPRRSSPIIKQRESKPGKQTVGKAGKSPPASPSLASVKSLSGSLDKTSNMSGKAPAPASKQAVPPAERTPSANRASARQSPRQGGGGAVQRDDLAACRFCQRRFASDRIQTHEDICSRTGKKKRKTYDATKHRVTGTELEPYVKKVTSSKSAASGKATAQQTSKTTQSKSKQVKSAASKNNNWRQKHEEFIGAIRAAKQAQQHVAKGGKLSDLPPPPPSSNPDYIQCPHCGRRFNESAAQRHIPKCATYDYNKPKPGMKPNASAKK